jgi:hypothetical protein
MTPSSSGTMFPVPPVSPLPPVSSGLDPISTSESFLIPPHLQGAEHVPGRDKSGKGAYSEGTTEDGPPSIRGTPDDKAPPTTLASARQPASVAAKK